MNLRCSEVFLVEKVKTAFIFLNLSSLSSIFCKGVHEFIFLPRTVGVTKILNVKTCYTAEKDNFKLDFNSYLRRTEVI